MCRFYYRKGGWAGGGGLFISILYERWICRPSYTYISPMPATHPETLVVGASISGLALAACLQEQGIDYTLIEQENEIAHPWRNHYERLHLHTSKRFSNLPYKKFGTSIPRYPSRQQVI